MNRRVFLSTIAVTIIITPFRGEAQQPGLLRIGWLSTAPHPFIGAFRAGLRDLGYVEGQSVVIEERYAEGQPERLRGLAQELIARHVDLLVTSGSGPALAAKETTTTLPIVSITADHLALGLVGSLAQPGGNITGLTLVSADLSVKWLELLKGTIPKLTRVGVLVDTSQSSNVQFERMAAAATLDVHLVSL